MYCETCGTKNSDDAAFCMQCGAPLSSERAEAPIPVQAPLSQVAPYNNAVGNGQSLYGSGNAYGQGQPYQPAPAPSYAPPAYAEGCVSAAWHDIRATTGWFKKVLLLALVQCVPILNFVVPGFALRWARDLSFGTRESMPQHIFEEKAFSTGFFANVVLVLFWIVSFLMGYILGFIPFMGWVVVTVLSVFLGMFVNACIIRMAVVDRFGAAFGFSQVWVAYKKQLGSLFCVSVLPGLVVGVVVFMIFVVIGILVWLILGVGIMSSASMSYGNRNAILIGGALIVGLLGLLMTALGATLSQMLTYRALGHWASRVAPEWAAESYIDPYATPYASVPTYSNPYSQVPVPAPMPTAMPAPAPVAAPVLQSTPTPAPTFVPTPQPAPTPPSASGPHDGATTYFEDVQPPATGSGTLTLERENGERFAISSFPATVGKGSAANVCVGGNESISRVHVRISQAGASLVVEDLGATNKTYLNGDCLAEGEMVILKEDDQLGMGGEIFIVRIG